MSWYRNTVSVKGEPVSDLIELIFMLSVPCSILLYVRHLNRRADRGAEAAEPDRPIGAPAVGATRSRASQP
jgi:hypothetical protein